MINEIITDERLQQFVDTATRLDFLDATTGEVEAMVTELSQRRAADKNYFMYGIAEPDGSAYMDEVCVSHDMGLLETIASDLNIDEGTDGYRVVALFTALPLTNSEREELEAAQKYAKDRDTENKDLMLTVGKLRVEKKTQRDELLAALEGADKAITAALLYLPADDEAVFCGEWLAQIREAIANAKGGTA